MRAPVVRIPVEVLFTAGLAFIAILLSKATGMPFVLPGARAATMVGVNYLFPLFAIVAWLACATLTGRKAPLRSTLTMLVCYVVVMWLYFNIKLWAHHINPASFDALYWSTDQAVRPIVDGAIAATAAMRGWHPIMDGLYMFGFIAMFFISFCTHAVRSPAVFRIVFLAAIFLQGTGAIAYLVMPALGPFLYEPGAIPLIGNLQRGMLEAHREAMVIGADWVRLNGGENMTAGLAAMPSLHAGGGFLFLYFIARYERPLLLIYLPLFLFILIAAIGTRWHYVIDLPVGIALAVGCIAMAYRLDRVTLSIPLPRRRRAAQAIA